MFCSITGKWPEEVEPTLLRVPIGFVPYTSQARYFVAHFMPKLNDMLLDSDREKDVLILKKLKDSKYNTAVKIREYAEDKERKKLGHQMSVDRTRMDVEMHNRKARNSATDWGTVKGRVKVGRHK
jgi:hypothetical protein